MITIAEALPYARTEDGAAVRDIADVRAWLIERVRRAWPDLEQFPETVPVWPNYL